MFMKLIFAIMQDDDSRKVTDTLNSLDFRVTKLCSTGGFLKAGNTTLMIGIKDEELENVLDIIKTNSKRRKQYMQTSAHSSFNAGIVAGGIEVNVRGLYSICY
jgi:uncharacterized protein YaaQ